jgi:hypothetical protein
VFGEFWFSMDLPPPGESISALSATKSSELLRIKTTKTQQPDQQNLGRIRWENVGLERGESSANHRRNSPFGDTHCAWPYASGVRLKTGDIQSGLPDLLHQLDY